MLIKKCDHCGMQDAEDSWCWTLAGNATHYLSIRIEARLRGESFHLCLNCLRESVVTVDPDRGAKE